MQVLRRPSELAPLIRRATLGYIRYRITQTAGGTAMKKRFPMSRTGERGVQWCRFRVQKENSGSEARMDDSPEGLHVSLGRNAACFDLFRHGPIRWCASPSS